MKGEKMKEYRITKEQCQKHIDDMGDVVCPGCGGKVEPIETVDNSDNPTYWAGCMSCFCFTSGTSLMIHHIAVKMVDEKGFRAYSHTPKPDQETKPEEFAYWRLSQIRGTAHVVSDILSLKESINPLKG